MYYGKKKGITIAIIVAILVIVLGIVGFFILTQTDILKSDKEVFFKYMGQTLESMKFVENEQLTDIEDLKKEMSYTKQGTLTCTSDNKELGMLKNFKVVLNSTSNPDKETTYSKADLVNSKDNSNIFSIEYAKNKNIYGLKSDEIVTAFVGIENANLKPFAQKLGIKDTSIIPDSLQTNNFDVNELFLISEEEKSYILENYMPIINKNITDKNFSKSKDLTISRDGTNYNTTEYRLQLSSEELNNLEIAVLEELTEDSVVLNILTTKAKILGLDNNYSQVNNLVTNIRNLIQNLKNGSIQNDGITINIYVSNNKVISTEIILNNGTKLTIYGETILNESRYHLIMESFNSSGVNKLELDINEIRNEDSSSYNIIIGNDKTELSINMQIVGTASSKKINTSYEIVLNQNNEETIFDYEEETNFKDEVPTYIEINRTNCAVLNDYTKEQLDTLLQALSVQITNVINQKIQLISLNNQITNNNQSINTENNLTNNNNQNTITNEQQSTFQEPTQSYVDSMGVNGQMYENPRAVQ